MNRVERAALDRGPVRLVTWGRQARAGGAGGCPPPRGGGGRGARGVAPGSWAAVRGGKRGGGGRGGGAPAAARVGEQCAAPACGRGGCRCVGLRGDMGCSAAADACPADVRGDRREDGQRDG